MYDIVIVGGGPAGATLARHLRKKYKILLLDKRNLLSDQDHRYGKCCGGLLSEKAQTELAKEGLSVPKQILVSPQTFAIQTVDFDNRIEKLYQKHYINVDRERFDRWLISLIPQNVAIRQGTYVSHRLLKLSASGKEKVLVKCRINNKLYVVKTKILVGADGATSKIRRSFLPKAEQHRAVYTSIQRWYRWGQPMPYYISTFDQEVNDYYSWVIPKDEVAIVGTAVRQGQNPNQKLDIVVDKLNKLGYGLEQQLKSEGTWIIRGQWGGQVVTGRDQVCLVGEAAGFISPSSSEGISYAIKSGRALAQALNQNPIKYQAIYRKTVNRLRIDLLHKYIKSFLMYQKQTRKWIMRTGIFSVPLPSQYKNLK